VISGLDVGGHEYKVIDLDKDRFDPVMREKDLSAFVQASRNPEKEIEDLDPLIQVYVNKMRWAERIVMIFPIWWMTAPAMTKGFIDKVIFPAIAYDMDKGRLVSRLAIRKVTIITTMNTPADIYKDMFNNSIEGSLIKGTFRQIGIEDVRWISLNGVKQATQDQRTEWLKDIYEYFLGRRSNMAHKAKKPMMNG
jgi:putative NADPH-quinone reductase